MIRGRSTRKLFACAASVVAATASAGAAAARDAPSPQIKAFTAEADTYVSAAQPDTNFGRSTSLQADGSPQVTAYLRFRLKKVKGSIASITLLLHSQAGARTGYQVRRVSRHEWREQGLTYANAPRLSLRYTSSKPVRRGSWSAVDVSSFVIGDEDRVSLAITTRSALGVSFESRETKQGPRLVVRTADNEGAEKPLVTN